MVKKKIKDNNDDNAWKKEKNGEGGKESMAEGGEEAQRTAREHNNTERDEY